MNRIFKIIYNKRRNAMVVASEMTSASGKGSSEVSAESTSIFSGEGWYFLKLGQGVLFSCLALGSVPVFAQYAAGGGTVSSPIQSVALGSGSKADVTSTAVGSSAQATIGSATAIGANSSASAGGTAIGEAAIAKLQNSVALGDGSFAVPTSNISGNTALGITQNAGALPTGSGRVVAVGTSGSIGGQLQTRQIQYVAPGAVTATSTDAVNGSQLYSLAVDVQSLSTSTSTGISTNASNIGSLSTGLSTTSSNVDSLSTSTSTGLSTTNSSVSSLSTSTATGLSTTQSGVNSLSTGLSTTNSNVSSLSTSTSTGISTAQSGVKSLSTGLSTTNSNVSSLSTSTSTGLSTTQSGVNSLSTGLSTTNSTVSSLSTSTSTGISSLSTGVANSIQYDNPSHSSVTLGGVGATVPVALHNVAAGVNPTDAVNVSQLSAVNNNVNVLRQDMYAASSAAIAFANLPQAYSPGQSGIVASVGSYHGQSAIAVGFSGISDNGQWVSKVSASADSRGNVGAGVGVFHPLN
jgi:trimeric autotransporter adhesin